MNIKIHEQYEIFRMKLQYLQCVKFCTSPGEQSAAKPQHQASLDVRSGQHHPQSCADGHHNPGSR